MTFAIFSNYLVVHSEWTKTSLNSKSITSLENTPWGILAGENNSNIWEIPPPTNAVFISRNLGETWETLGLQYRGIVDIQYLNGIIYAATYYVRNGTDGLFSSSDKGLTWNHIGPNLTATKVSADSHTIYLGSETCGLWVSKDGGVTWTVKLAVACDGTKIYGLSSSEDVTLVSTLRSVYISRDHGDTWTEISTLAIKSLNFFLINNNVIFAGSSSTAGIYISTDSGSTWKKLTSFGDYATGGISFIDGKYYVGRQNPINDTYTIYSTSDLGNTWQNTLLEIPDSFDRTREISWIYSNPNLLFAAVLFQGVYKYQIPTLEPATYPIFNIPWATRYEGELIDTITSYFDHSYPLLGYNYFREPQPENSTTLNFLGIKDSEPTIYYSSHSGTDFALKYGTEILAAGSGYASYSYCTACGNTIKIDHLNGYESIYEHLQDEGLITKTGKIWVNINDKIGKVGMTGNTTGPHLHFEVMKDKGEDGNFLNDFPCGRTDPFGWLDLKSVDPWKNYSWTDSLGFHQGTESTYLWNINIPNSSSFINLGSDSTPSSGKSVRLGNKQVSFEDLEPSAFENFTVQITQYIRPILNYSQSNLRYVENTSFIINAVDQTGKEIRELGDYAKIIINLSSESILDVLSDTIRLFSYDETSSTWKPEESFFDAATNTLTSHINHFSKFAVFGESADNVPPETSITVSGTEINEWYTQYPLISLSTNDVVNGQSDAIYYSIDKGGVWNEYLEPFQILKDGITQILYRAQDIGNNTEETKSYVVQVNTSGKLTKTLRIIGSNFQTK